MRSKHWQIDDMERSCLSKLGFNTEHDAVAFIWHGYSNHLFKWEMMAYKCRYCDGWHIATR